MSAWRGLERFEERASLRAWLYRIATNRCLNFLRDSERRPHEPAAAVRPAAADPHGRAAVAAAVPGRAARRRDPRPGGPLRDARGGRPGVHHRAAAAPASASAPCSCCATRSASARPRSRACSTPPSRASTARCSGRAPRSRRAMPPRERAPAPGSARERELVSGFADAFEAGDIERVVALLTDDAWVTMPPEPHEYQGREAIADFLYHASAAPAPRPAHGPRADPRERPARARALHPRARRPGRPGRRGVRPRARGASGISMLTRFDGGQLVSRFGLPETVRDGRSGGTAAPPAGSR